jgi:hypothetical protein
MKEESTNKREYNELRIKILIFIRLYSCNSRNSLTLFLRAFCVFT